MPSPAKAYAYFLALQKIMEQLVKENPTVRGFRSDQAGLSNLLGVMNSSMGKPADAARDHERASQLWEQLAQANPDMPDYRSEVVTSLTNLGSNLQRLNQRLEAEEAFRKGIAVGEKLARDFSAVPGYQVELAGSYSGLIGLLHSMGRVKEAVEIRDKELAIRERLVATHPTVPEYSSGLGACCVRWGRWDQARAAFDKAAELEPGNHLHVYRAAALLLRAGDLADYRRACRAMLERFVDTDQPEVAEHTAKTCLLTPNAVADLDTVLKLADRAVTGTEKKTNYRWFVLVKGLADYRARRHADAAKWLRQFAPNAGGTHWDATAFAVLAMAEQGQGRGAEAQAALARAKTILAKMPEPAKGQLFDAGNWHDWLHAQVLCHEAEKVMTN
jgi:tetratricopeptide (TPR) repeat protein